MIFVEERAGMDDPSIQVSDTGLIDQPVT